EYFSLSHFGVLTGKNLRNACVHHPSAEATQQALLRKRRNADWFIVPGTLYCGPGNIYVPGGLPAMAHKTDKCCEAHDKCPNNIPAYGRRNQFRNQMPSTMSHCNCDQDARMNPVRENDKSNTLSPLERCPRLRGVDWKQKFKSLKTKESMIYTIWAHDVIVITAVFDAHAHGIDPNKMLKIQNLLTRSLVDTCHSFAAITIVCMNDALINCIDLCFRFFDCLGNANTDLADAVGMMYFDVARIHCFEEQGGEPTVMEPDSYYDANQD
ncbi:phospholipase A2, partial [Opisthorchis viverrini]